MAIQKAYQTNPIIALDAYRLLLNTPSRAAPGVRVGDHPIGVARGGGEMNGLSSELRRMACPVTLLGAPAPHEQ